MTDGGARERPPVPDVPAAPAPWRYWCLSGAAVVVLVALVPPLATTARRSEWAAALQFGLLALAVPALVTLGAPWRLLRLSGGRAGAESTVDRLADRRRRHPELVRSLGFIAADLAVVVAWHTPPAVAWVAGHSWPTLLEGLTLLVFGTGLWLELVPSPPLTPRSGHLRRAALGAVAMWVFWVLAYIVALSTHDFYGNFHHAPGGLSAAADQQFAAAVSWFVAAATFLPVIFWNAVMWLKTENDPDTELVTLLRAERRRGTPPLRGDEGSQPAS